jgi:hypothetical protein
MAITIDIFCKQPVSFALAVGRVLEAERID